MSQALYRKWRPQKWDEIVGQQHIVQTLRNAVTGGHVVHAYLFAGPRGTGKTTIARLLAKAVNCLAEDPAARPCNECAHCIAVNESRFLDLIEIDGASNNSVDDIRDLRDKINFTPNQGRYKIYIIDEVHMLSKEAFNALLKTLEEPPPHAIFVLATTEIHKIPATVISRCQRHEFRRLPVNDIVGQLQRIAASEKMEVEPEAILLIARQATGSFRDAISLLDQMASTGGAITLLLTQTVLGTATSQTVLDLLGAVVDRDPATGMGTIHKALDAGIDPRLLARQVVDYLRALLLVKMGNQAQVDLPAESHSQVERHAGAISTANILRMIRLFNAAATDLRGSWQPSLALELALAEAMETPVVAPMPAAPEKKNPPALDRKTPATIKTDKIKSELTDQKETEKPATGSSTAAYSTLKAKPAVNFEQIRNVWKQVCAAIKLENQVLNGLLNSCKLLGIKDGVLLLGFASEIVRSKADKPEQMEMIRKAITEAVGADVPVRCVISTAKQSVPPDVKADGMVAAALKAGGEIVDIQE